jgi:hypothetical protein
MQKQNIKKHLAFLSLVGIMFGSTMSYANAEQPAVEFYNGNDELTYTIHYESTTYDEVNDETTFEYSLSVFGSPALSHLSLEFACTDGASGLVDGQNSIVEIGTFAEPVIGNEKITGIKFDAGQDEDTTSTYTITLPGNIGTSDSVLVYGKGGNENSPNGNYVSDFWEISGPSCQTDNNDDSTTYSLDGITFVDANQNGIFDTDEPVIGNVTVSLYDEDGNLIAETTTDSTGYYVFEDLNPGNYTVVVEDTTTYDDFNETLSSEFNQTAPQPIQVTIVDADSTGSNFGFSPDFTQICEVQNEDGLCILSGDGKTIGFWKHQNAVAIKGKGKAHIDATTLTDYITQINGLFLTQPFQLSGFQDAFDVMKMTSSDPVDLLNKQLLGTEFNLVHGIGIENTELQSLLIAWGEYISAHSDEFTQDQILEAKDIFDGINNSGNN